MREGVGEMLDLEQLGRALREKKELAAAAESPEGKRIAAGLDEKALREAAKRGDTAALKQVLQQVLATPEGKQLAEKVKKAVDGK